MILNIEIDFSYRPLFTLNESCLQQIPCIFGQTSLEMIPLVTCSGHELFNLLESEEQSAVESGQAAHVWTESFVESCGSFFHGLVDAVERTRVLTWLSIHDSGLEYIHR